MTSCSDVCSVSDALLLVGCHCSVKSTFTMFLNTWSECTGCYRRNITSAAVKIKHVTEQYPVVCWALLCRIFLCTMRKQNALCLVCCSLSAWIWIATSPTDDTVHRTMCMSSHVVMKTHWKQEWNGFNGVGPFAVFDHRAEKVLELFRCCFCYWRVTIEKVIMGQNNGFLCP